MRFPELRARAARAEAERRSRDERAQKILFAKYEQIKRDVDAVVSDIRETLSQMNACFNILVPDLFGAAREEGKEEGREDGIEWEEVVTVNNRETAHAACVPPRQQDGDDDEDEDEIEWEEVVTVNDRLDTTDAARLPLDGDDEEDAFERDSVAGGSVARDMAYELEIEVPLAATNRVETADTAPLFDTLRENQQLLTAKLRPILLEWENTLTRVRCDGDSPDMRRARRSRDDLLCRVIDAKNEMDESRRKCGELKVSTGRRRRRNNSVARHVPWLPDQEAATERGVTERRAPVVGSGDLLSRAGAGRSMNGEQLRAAQKKRRTR